ncbi:hypothetical protein [Bacillus sp. MMSF_3328]|uniref:hypothetical protein n=1 Tax=Bacillus sp. MMSF_3328 TaxID=3047080 RepID=UPI00273FC2F5|nr:hypothetical protein [Bacillus sp. MMSF_3328]
MNKDLELLSSQTLIEYAKKLESQYVVSIDGQDIGIKIYVDSNGYYQMDTSHYYQGPGRAGVYITSAANFDSAEEALIIARNQLSLAYDNKGQWVKNINY